MRIPTLVVLLLVLSACGGGGDSSSGGAPEAPPIPSTARPGLPVELESGSVPESEPPVVERGVAPPPQVEPEPGSLPESEPPVVERDAAPPRQNAEEEEEEENAEAKSWADRIKRAAIGDDRTPLFGHTIDGGSVTHDSGTPASSSTGFAAITGWTGARHTHTHTPPGEPQLVSEFITYTDKSGSDDKDYMDFGYWIATYTLNDPATVTVVTPISAASMISGTFSVKEEFLDVVALPDATYSGAATGRYASKVSGLYRTHGQFIADVSLTADFTAVDANNKKLVAVSGTIANFKDSSGAAIGSSWSVTLNSASFQAKERNPYDYVTGATGRGGAWKYNFAGRLSDGTTAIAPSGIIGGFREEFTDGVAVGAFAAKKNTNATN